MILFTQRSLDSLFLPAGVMYVLTHKAFSFSSYVVKDFSILIFDK